MRRLLLVAALIAGTLGSGCGGIEPPNAREPLCDDTEVLLLAAQSVPSAKLIPCVEVKPLGWDVSRVFINQDGMTFRLHSDIGGDSAVRVTFAASCELGRAVRIPTDEVGTERYELPKSIERGFSGLRTYTFEGGCTTLEFDFGVGANALLSNEASLAIGFTDRSGLNEGIRLATDGREQLDPPADR